MLDIFHKVDKLKLFQDILNQTRHIFVNKTKNFHKIIKKIVTKITREGFKINKGKTHSYFQLKEHTEVLIEQTRSRPQETFEFELNRQMEFISFNPPLNLSEEGKWLLAVVSFETTNSVFKITDENNSFLNTIPGHYNTKSEEKTVEEVKN